MITSAKTRFNSSLIHYDCRLPLPRNKHIANAAKVRFPPSLPDAAQARRERMHPRRTAGRSRIADQHGLRTPPFQKVRHLIGSRGIDLREPLKTTCRRGGRRSRRAFTLLRSISGIADIPADTISACRRIFLLFAVSAEKVLDRSTGYTEQTGEPPCPSTTSSGRSTALWEGRSKNSQTPPGRRPPPASGCPRAKPALNGERRRLCLMPSRRRPLTRWTA